MLCIASMRREFFVLVSPIIFWTMLVTVVARELYVYCYSFHVYWKAGAHNIFNSVVLFLFSYFFFAFSFSCEIYARRQKLKEKKSFEHILFYMVYKKCAFNHLRFRKTHIFQDNASLFYAIFQRHSLN